MKSIVTNAISFLYKSVLLHQMFLNNILLSKITAVSLAVHPTKPFTWDVLNNVSLPTIKIIENYGYAFETHHVITEDGYILEMHRMPKGKHGIKPTRNYPVLLHHAFLSTSAVWVLSGSNTSLAMQLVDAGFDVWLANCRGNTYSKNHVSLDPNKNEFWKFSLHEIGKYDLPSEIDYILMKTKAPQLHYIGYSMGTSVFYIMASERPEYQQKIRSQISLAPVAYLTHLRSPIKFFAPYAKTFGTVYTMFTNGELLPQSKLRTLFASTICGGVKMLRKFMCEQTIIFLTCGSDPYHFNTNIIPLIMGHFPAGTSSMVVTHFSQFRLRDDFGPYDYGLLKNMKLYNSTEPPSYNLKSIQVPITLIHGKNDLLSVTNDVMRLKNQLPKLMDVILIDSPYFNHVDFLWSLNVNKLVNEPVKEILNKTDDINWVYSSGPNPSMTSVKNVNFASDKKKMVNISDKRPTNSVNQLKYSSLKNISDNLDSIIESIMPRPMNDNDMAEFKRQSERQKILLGVLIELFKSFERNYRQNRLDLNDKFSNSTRVKLIEKNDDRSSEIHNSNDGSNIDHRAVFNKLKNADSEG